MFNNFTCEKCGRRLGNSSLCPDCDRDMLIDGIATVAKRGGTNQCLEQWLCEEAARLYLGRAALAQWGEVPGLQLR